MNRIKNFKKGFAAAAAFCIAGASLAGCAGGAQKGTAQSEAADSVSVTGTKTSGADTKAMGRYLEESLAVPEGAKAVTALKFLDSGKLRILYNDKDFLLHWADSEDNGKTWKESEPLIHVVNGDSAAESVVCAALGHDGSIFAISLPTAGDSDPNTLSFRFYSISPDGTATEISSDANPKDAYIFHCAVTDKNTFLFETSRNGIKEISPKDGSLIREYEAGNNVDYFGIAGSCLTVLSGGSPHYYDLETGNPADNMDALTEQILSEPDNLYIQSTSSFPVLFTKSPETDALFYIDKNGLYSYTPGNTSVEKLIDGALNSISSPVTGFTDMAQDKDGSFYLSVMDSSGSNPVGKIYKYTYDKNTATVPDTELTIYALSESSLLQQAATVFQKENPDVYIHLETGLSGNDSVTTTDALKVLNTEILAGKGPDLLLLDGIPSDTYIEKGMLEDISGLLKDVPLLENIKNAYTKDDGNIYTFPVKFGIPLIEGPKEYIDTISDLKTLADAAEAHKEEYSSTSFFTSSGMSPELLLKALTDVNMPAWFQKDGTLNKDAVTEYFRETGRIYQTCRDIVEEMLKQYGQTDYNFAGDYNRHQWGVAGTAMNVLGGYEKVGFGGLYSPNDLSYLDSTNRANDSLCFRLWDGQSKNTFYPEQIIALNAKAAEKESAEKFIQFLFSEEGQKFGTETGFPVLSPLYEDQSYWITGDTDAISYASSSNSETGETTELSIYQPSEEAIKEIVALGKTLTVPSEDNLLIQNAIVKAGAKYLRGDTSLEEAVNAAMQEINLYLSE